MNDELDYIYPWILNDDAKYTGNYYSNIRLLINQIIYQKLIFISLESFQEIIGLNINKYWVYSY